MADKRALSDLNERDIDMVSAGQSIHIAIVVRSSDQTITQTGGSQLDVKTNNRTIIDGMSIGKPSR
ncbi:hypothetical protein [Bradyrhizobium sp. WSM1743]|uniref:hypothetical protein n=1 Tax=Bradyrhizobium sp. WSM1743 TaxID=318996 RepID=UPI0003FBBE8D|nr:hypothetical protein [Bradyrhizobium sp. WSM1743]